MVPSTNRSGHRPFKAEMPGSNPAGITIYRIGVTSARLTLTQAVEVQILDPVPTIRLCSSAEKNICLSRRRPRVQVPSQPPYGSLVKMVKTPASQAGSVGFKSHRSHQYARMVERQTRRFQVPVLINEHVSSNLTLCTNTHKWRNGIRAGLRVRCP